MAQKTIRSNKPIAVTAIMVMTLVSSLAWAHDGVKNPTVLARMDGMTATAAALKQLGDMARGASPLHQAKARMARDTLVRQAGKIPALFAEPATDPHSEALPNIWKDFTRFETLSLQMQESAMKLDFTDRAALNDSLRDLGGTCRACHKSFRKP